MAYIVGISSGWWRIARDPNLQGLAIKAASFGATAGVTFNQLDLESPAEFLEPRVKQNIKRVQKELGLKLGLHAEIGGLAALESAERRIWEQSHLRLLETIKNAIEMGFVYVNFHLSSTPILQFEEQRIRPFGFQYQVVSPEGKPFWAFADKSPGAKAYINKIILGGHMRDVIVRGEPFRKIERGIVQKYKGISVKRQEDYVKEVRSSPDFSRLPQSAQRELEDRERRRALREVNEELESELQQLSRDPDVLYDAWKQSEFAQYILEAGEIDAYLTVAHGMRAEGDTLWSQIAKNNDPEKSYNEDEFAFNAAVAARYLEGHLRVSDHPLNKRLLDGRSVLDLLNRSDMVAAFELPEVEGEHEALYRLFDPRHAYWFVKKMNSPKVRLCIDFEHMLAQHLDPYKVIPQLPDDTGKYIFLFHLGEPKPYKGQAHIPIPLSSQAQEIIYEWLYMFRKKGFKEGIIIFERGAGVGGNQNIHVFGQSVTAMRQIAKYLDQDVKPDELPLEFYGLSEQNEPEFARQRVSIREHALDPLEGVLSIPEEKHTFLSAAAVAKQKGPEWEKRKLR